MTHDKFTKKLESIARKEEKGHWLKPEGVNKPGRYLMARTDDDLEPFIVTIIESWDGVTEKKYNFLVGGRVLSHEEGGEIQYLDPECRFFGPIPLEID